MGDAHAVIVYKTFMSAGVPVKHQYLLPSVLFAVSCVAFTVRVVSI